MSGRGQIRIGVGGWTFEPWRGGAFYPEGLRQAKELEYASRQLTAIEINGTYYGSQKPETWRKWRQETPEGFIFSVKGSRFCTNRKVLAEGAEAVGRFFAQGLTELGDRLGPILWQLANTKKFDPDDIAGVIDILPQDLEGRRLRHVLEPRHDSFRHPEFVALCRERGIGVALADHATYPMIPDLTADFVYCRLQTGHDDTPTAYPPEQLEQWAGRFEAWAQGAAPQDLPYVTGSLAPDERPRDVFAFIIHEGKVRAPAGALALIERVGRP
jgi:uncharacterized protein YecE (DUF72 family)